MPKRGRKDDSLSKHLERLVAAEIDGDEEITNPQKFALQVKYGLVDPVLTADELKSVRAEEANIG